MKKSLVLLFAVISILCSNINLTSINKENINLEDSISSIVDKQKNKKSSTDETTDNNEENSESTENINLKQTETPVNISYNNDSLGTMGRLYLSEVNFSVAVNYANPYTDTAEGYDAQYIVDKEDSAAYFQFGNKEVIADHNYQGFNRLIDLTVGTTATIKKSEEQQIEYKLINKFVGRNIVEDIVDNNGNSIQNMAGNLVMYTCYNTGDSVMITLWERIG